MKLSIKNIRKGIGIVFLFTLAYLFLFGRFLPFSPLIPGFEKQESDKAIVYYHKTDAANEFAAIDKIIEEVEKFHGLKLKKKVKIFLTASEREHKHYSGTTARFVTHPPEGRIFISNRAKNEYRNRQIRFDTYIKHELSHTLLYQNMSLIRSLSYPAWFMEGMAMYSARQVGTDGYYSYEQTKETIANGIFVVPADWGTIISGKGETVRNCPHENKYWFIYSEFALLVNNMAVKYGEDKLMDFLKSSLTEKDFYELFERTFRQSFEAYLDTVKTGV